MQLCSVDLAEMKLMFTEEEAEDAYALFDVFTNFYRQLSGNKDWRAILTHDPSVKRGEIVFTIEKKYEQRVRRWFKGALYVAHNNLEEVKAPENMAVEIDREIFFFTKKRLKSNR